MNGKKLIGMAVALVLLVAIAVLQKNSGKSAASSRSGKGAKLLEGIDLNAVTSIDVVQGSNSVALIKPDGKWAVGSLYGYPAAFNNLAHAIRTAAQVDLGQPVRAGNVAESEYGFDANAKKLVLKAGDKTVTTILIGAKRKGSDSAGSAKEVFIRKDDDPSIYLVDYDFGAFSANAEDWLDKQLVGARSSDMVSVKTDDVDLKLDGTTWKLADLDPDTEGFQAAVANRLPAALQYLSCDSVADPSRTDEELGFDKPVHYTAKTRDGFTYNVTLGAKTLDGRYARFAVEYTKPQPPSAPEKDADQTKQDEYKKALDTYNTSTAANAKKATELTTKLSNWTYVISTYSANSLTISRAELVQKKTPPAEMTNVSNALPAENQTPVMPPAQ